MSTQNFRLDARGLCILCLLVLACVGCRPEAKQTAFRKDSSATFAAEKIEPWKFRCLDGSMIEPFSKSTTKAIVLVFIGTDCPIANAYHPKLQELENEFTEKGVEFFLIHSNSDVTLKEAEEHAAKYALTLPIVLDDNQRIARRAGAKVTPETFVFVPHQSAPIYRGAIDNLYADYGKKRQVVSEHYLRDCLRELLAGKQITTPETKPLGCFLFYDPTPDT